MTTWKLLAMVALGGTAAWFLTSKHRGSTDGKITLVVLGSSSLDRQDYRVEATLRLMRDVNVRRIIFTGRGEAPRMAEKLVERLGAPPPFPIVIENNATNTQRNIELVQGILENGENVVLISDHHHVRGASHCLARTGRETLFYQAPIPHHGYATEAGFDIHVTADELPAPVLQPAPEACEAGYYFFCC